MPSEFYEKPCPCGKSVVKWEAYEKYSSWGGIEYIPREIICPDCQKSHEIKRVSGTDKYGTDYSYVEIRKRKNDG